ncbi:hypothetical protein EM868_21780 [Cupriavidus gilardii]|nr:hypothetical protein [Cupriavidus gilardii]
MAIHRSPGWGQAPRADAGAVATSSCVSQCSAASRDSPHISADGCRPPQKAGRSGRPNTAQRISGSNCAHGTPAGLPWGMPGRGEAIDGAIQQAPQSARQETSDWQGIAMVQNALAGIRPRSRSLRRPAPKPPLCTSASPGPVFRPTSAVAPGHPRSSCPAAGRRRA